MQDGKERLYLHVLCLAGAEMLYRRGGKPTDNPVNESLNGWIKEELFLDFNLDKSDDIPGTVAGHIDFYNKMRPCYAFGYDIPSHYEQRYRNGELGEKDTFRNRVLTETPKFVQKKLSTSKNESEGKTQDLSTLGNRS
ncbi:MAG: integrase core domain-containing protein [Firmicutes bacterium]|nr:integrase core domain-containing protein [Bacillota bacterium]